MGDEGENCDLGEKTELAMDVGRLDTCGRTAEVSQSLEGSSNIVGHSENNILYNTRGCPAAAVCVCPPCVCPKFYI